MELYPPVPAPCVTCMFHQNTILAILNHEIGCRRSEWSLYCRCSWVEELEIQCLTVERFFHLGPKRSPVGNPADRRIYFESEKVWVCNNVIVKSHLSYLIICRVLFEKVPKCRHEILQWFCHFCRQFPPSRGLRVWEVRNLDWRVRCRFQLRHNLLFNSIFRGTNSKDVDNQECQKTCRCLFLIKIFFRLLCWLLLIMWLI